MTASIDPSQEPRVRGLKFVTRIYRMRVLGTTLSILPIASVLAERSAAWSTWLLLACTALAWPQLAFWLARRARDPVAREFRNLIMDSALGGAWIAAIAVSGAPTAVLLTVLVADRLAAGGWSLVQRASIALVGGFLLVWILSGFPFEPEASLRTRLLTVPFLCAYTVTLSVLTYRLAQRIREQNRELERLNRTDPVMQLPNRPHFEKRAAQELTRFHRTGRPASILLVDVDRFKRINDRHGHGMGDVVLKRIGALLRDGVREIDLAARYGGDEFAVLLVETDAAAAERIAERIRQAAALEVFEAEPGLSCTLSIGVAEVHGDDASLDTWVRAADAALYRAKAAGRNRVVRALRSPPLRASRNPPAPGNGRRDSVPPPTW